MASIAQEINSLANILTLSPQEFRHVLLCQNVEIAPGAIVDLFNYDIPLYNGFLITGFEMKLIDQTGVEINAKRGAVAFGQWLANGQPIGEAGQIENFTTIFQVFGDGDLIALRLQLSKDLANQNYSIICKASCFYLPSSKTSMLVNNATIVSNRNGRGKTQEVFL